ncbi:Sad1 and UNC84 domain-containing protein [Bulinus truncatus]|nr:Sad1 and UNC84 domain-containing protein [Bulinus truncatus]
MLLTVTSTTFFSTRERTSRFSPGSVIFLARFFPLLQSSRAKISSVLSADSDNERECRRKEKYTWRSFGKLIQKLSCRLQFVNPRNCGYLGFYLLFSLFMSALIYFYGLTVIHQLARLLRIAAQILIPATWLKTTEEIVEEALYKYSADRLGLTDYALESSGATVLCSSETYYSKSGFISVFNLPTWYHASSASSVIQPDVQPGNCWAMNGNHGFVTIQLVMPVVITAVTLEHIPKEISVAGRLDSAPRDFLIVGKERGLDSPDIIFGTFTYKLGENPIQLFHLKDPYCLIKEVPEKCGPNKLIISIVTLKILNNYGNQEYTCIYRFRVHGNPQPSA